MIVAICAKTEGLESVIDDRFGRCENFVIYNSETKEVNTISNSAKEEPSGAGGKVVSILNEHNVQVIVAPELGPKAVTAIHAFEMIAYSSKGCETVQDAIDKLYKGELFRLADASVESHSGLRKA